jgi:threonine aldolase
MISFECDYNNGAHPKVLGNLIKYNEARPTPYGFDEFSDRAKDRIREACGMPDAQIFFLTGGTQTNATTIDSMLYQYEGVICVETGHINVHEAGAVEFTEHKIITLPGDHGKMNPKVLDKYLDDFMHDGNNAHAVFPGLVYITFPTELGTIYSAKELDDIYQVCQHYEIPLYIDGARLGYGLMAEGNDITLPYLARHCDVFYIGGTKIGALCGEAVVFTNRQAHKHFFSIQKQHGAVIAKGALIGLQFEALFTDNLYFDLARHAIEMAMKMKRIFQKKEVEFYIDSPTNQQFVILPDALVEKLSKVMVFTHWGQAPGHHTICRFVTSWTTTKEDLDTLENILNDAQ